MMCKTTRIAFFVIAATLLLIQIHSIDATFHPSSASSCNCCTQQQQSRCLPQPPRPSCPLPAPPPPPCPLPPPCPYATEFAPQPLPTQHIFNVPPTQVSWANENAYQYLPQPPPLSQQLPQPPPPLPPQQPPNWTAEEPPPLLPTRSITRPPLDGGNEYSAASPKWDDATAAAAGKWKDAVIWNKYSRFLHRKRRVGRVRRSVLHTELLSH